MPLYSMNLTMDDFMKAKNALVKAKVPMCNFVSFTDASVCTTLSGCAPCQKEDKPMACDNNERRYLRDRVFSTSSQKLCDAIATFHISDDGEPRTYAELIDFIKNDKFTLDAKKTALVDVSVLDHGYSRYGLCCGINWTGRVVKDQAGYDAFNTANSKKIQDTLDVVMTQDNVAGLKALQDYEAWTPTTVAA